MSKIRTISKMLSLALRHKPEALDITLDENGWADVEKVIEGIQKKYVDFDFEQLYQVVEKNDKKRFSFNDVSDKIRANQGHSVTVDVELKVMTPPDVLFHGTVSRFLEPILSDGLHKMNRHHVHLSDDLATAKNVASRRGKPVILKIDSGRMLAAGYKFFQSENGVWLTDNVPSKYIIH